MKNIIFCDGGLANRLNTLIAGIFLAENVGGDWEISWPENNWCGAQFKELFDIELPINNYNLNKYSKHTNEYFFLFHEDQLKFNPKNMINIRDMGSFKTFKSSLPIFYYNNLIPKFIDDISIKYSLNKIIIKKKIKKIVEDFCKENIISEEIIGIHIRKTDFGDSVDDEALFKIVDGHSRRFFICTDDKVVAEKFKKLSNCILYEHENYVDKRKNECNWNSEINDDEGRILPFNVKRSSENVQIALVELLILSRTTLVHTSNSTFLNMAKIYKKYNYF